MWEGYALIPTGSLLSNFIIYVLCLFSYCIFYIILILFINVYCKQNYGILGPLFIHCILFLWWEFQIHELTQSLIHQKFMRLMMQSWIGLLIWITITSVFLYLIYKRMPFVLSKEKNDSSLNHFRQPFFVSKWFWISTLLFTAIVLYSLWNTPSPDYYTSSFGAEKAGINLYFQAFTSISWLWTSYAYIFAFLSCIDIYRNSYKDQTPWKSLLHAALRGIMMSICTSIFVIVFCTITTGNLYISESIHAMLFSDSIVNSVLHGSILVFIHQLIWLPIATMAGYFICSIIRNWHYCFSILAFFFSCGSYILNTILQGTFLDSCVPVAPFSIGPQAIEFKILFKEWTFLFCLIVLVMVFSRYYHKKTTMVSKEKFI